MFAFINLVRAALSKVQKNNKENPDVKTADESVFENLSRKMEREEKEIGNNVDRREMFDRLRRKVEETQYENEADPQVETADPSVFDDLMKEIEAANEKFEYQERQQSGRQHTDTYNSDMHHRDSHAPTSEWGQNESVSPKKQVNSFATTSSNGGSLQMTMEPQIGGAVKSIRVPHGSQVRIIQFSDNIINLDGRNSRFAYIDYNGQQGWIPETYLI